MVLIANIRGIISLAGRFFRSFSTTKTAGALRFCDALALIMAAVTYAQRKNEK